LTSASLVRTSSALKSIARLSDSKVNVKLDLRDHKVAELIYGAVMALGQSDNQGNRIISQRRLRVFGDRAGRGANALRLV
jgi:hypothetical protein